MRIIQVHNRHRFDGGEETAVDATVALLRARGHRVWTQERDSRGIGSSFLGKLRASVSGIYNRSAALEMSSLIRDYRPDVVHVHNLFPLLSPSVLAACRRAGVPAVMTCHNYRLACPTGLHLRDGAACTKCRGGREHWCVAHRCRGSLLESAAYAARSAVHRYLGSFRRNVALFITPSQFGKDQLARSGLDERRIRVVHNFTRVPPAAADPAAGHYIAFVGRISPEKGLKVLLSAAASAREVPVRVAGDLSAAADIADGAPENVSFSGWLGRDELDAFYAGSRAVVLPAPWFEVCPLVLLEAMARGIPVIASRTGPFLEMVEDGVTGLLSTPGDAGDLAAKMRLLWKDADLCRRLGRAARERAARDFSEEAHYGKLIDVYEEAIAAGRRGHRHALRPC